MWQIYEHEEWENYLHTSQTKLVGSKKYDLLPLFYKNDTILTGDFSSAINHYFLKKVGQNRTWYSIGVLSRAYA